MWHAPTEARAVLYDIYHLCTFCFSWHEIAIISRLPRIENRCGSTGAILENKRTLLLLVRHGETEWNNQQRYQGQTDTLLNERGREQARLLAARLATLPLQAVYSSDMARSRECAQIIAAPHKLVVQELVELRERCFGALEGLTREEAMQCEWWAQFESSDAECAPPEGESRTKQRERIMTAVERITARHEGGNVVIVSHGGTLGQIIGAVMGVPTEKRMHIRMDNCSLSVVQYDRDRKALLGLNDVSHLYPQAAIGACAAIAESRKYRIV
jgi:2,3-bisphosphoglycerate-dependent phosphoglycerate mutase